MTDVDALTALTEGDRRRARQLAAAGTSLLAGALTAYLDNEAAGSVYDQPAAFEAFISGGGNVGLYAAVEDALADQYRELAPSRLADIGCGDGRVVRNALASSGHLPDELTLVEPSAALLARAVRDLTPTRAYAGTVQLYLSDVDTEFDLVESTFAMHTIRHDERTEVLARLRDRAERLVIVDFDVPAVEHGSPAHLRFLAETYERGLSEYAEDRDLVAQGFLMPVLVGQLTPGARRVTWEQPAAAWRAQLEKAGYRTVSVATLHDYWSSPAFLLIAQ
ncbi:class I SAM-dependent methyltransferase [Kutzneria kofuensis]|uniref:SAM-dependent methyltransferase n=1 Tax=Kutzneria kofuensis TaxID=103725 RepID=A0A7W9KNS0_9PSEU|nr:class I SAM-dependent methyltransferase [Kutzneria kofuensis]MBB5895857.1 SAM-dependent methyltransferase [Kutzneria kofuensis]